ncbi:MAG: AMP-binding protein, partial [Bdellovibrionota bacterium]
RYDKPKLNPLDTCAVLYTSGTTSRPKGVMITQGNYVWSAEIMSRTQGLRETDRHLVCLPYFHINAQTYSTLPSLAVGADIVLMERFSKTRFWNIVQEHKPTVWSYVPALTKMLVMEPPGPHEKNHSFRLWGGGAVATALEQKFNVRTIGWFGMTETITTPVVTSPIDPGKNRAVGFVNPGYRIRIVGEDGKPCGPNETGELEILGVPGISLMKGYLKNPEATAEALSPEGWFKTGDNVTIDEEGYVFYVNRKKDMLKVGGENVASSEIERVLMMHPAVYEAAVIGIPDNVLQEVPKAFIILNPGKSASEQEIIDYCKGKLATFKVPRAVEFRKEFPRATLEKVAKKQLAEEESEKRRAATTSG